MNRADLQQLADIRLADVKQLLSTGTNDAGAYYMAGYVVECALKAVIAKNQGLYPYPDFSEPSFKKDNYFSHSARTLVNTAQLKDNLDRERTANPNLGANWSIVESWSEGSRYENKSRQDSETLIQAIEHPTEGVLQWIRNHW